MKAFGYNDDQNDQTQPLGLRETTLLLSRDELDEVIAFLQNIRKEFEQAQLNGGSHWHFQDWSKKWTDTDADLIIVQAPPV